MSKQKTTKGKKPGTFGVQERIRTVVSVTGNKFLVRGVSKVDNSGTWTRLDSEDGYVIINPSNVLAYIVPMEAKVR
jgi:hypothetical protein